MANPKIDSIQFSGSTTKYDINLPTNATPSIARLTVNGDSNFNGMLNVNPNSTGLPSAIITPMIYGTTSNGLSLGNWIAATSSSEINLTKNGGISLSAPNDINLTTSDSADIYITADNWLCLQSNASTISFLLGSDSASKEVYVPTPAEDQATLALMENFPAYTHIVRNEVSYAGSSGEFKSTLNGYINCKEYTNSGKKFCQLINADLWVYLTNESAIGATYDITLRKIIGPVIDKAGTALNCNGANWQDTLYASLHSIEIYVKGTPKTGYCYIPLTKMGNLHLASNGKLIKIGEKIHNERYNMDQYGNGSYKALSEYTESLSDIFDGISTTTSAAPDLSKLKMVSVTEENIDVGSISAGNINVLMHIILH